MIKDWVSPQRPTETADFGNHSSAKVKVSREIKFDTLEVKQNLLPGDQNSLR